MARRHWQQREGYSGELLAFVCLLVHMVFSQLWQELDAFFVENGSLASVARHLHPTTVAALLNGVAGFGRGPSEAGGGPPGVSLVRTPDPQSGFDPIGCLCFPMGLVKAWTEEHMMDGKPLLDEFVALGGLDTALALILSPLPTHEDYIKG